MDNEYDWQELWDKVIESIGQWEVLKEDEDGNIIHALMEVELDSGEEVKLYVRYDEIEGLDYMELFTKDIEKELIDMGIVK